MKSALLLLFFLLSTMYSAQGKDSLQIIKAIPIKAHHLQVDEVGNAYLVREDNMLIKYNDRGDSIANFMTILNGDISFVDVTNPLRVMLYYAQFAQLVLLDRMLAPKNELNLRKLNQLNASGIAISAEGNLWVYDQFNATLNKLDMELNLMLQGNDLRQQLAELPKPVYLIERDRRVYMVDADQGILIFDQYGSYMNTLSILGIKKVQIVGNQIIYQKENNLFAYDIQKLSEKEIKIPQLINSRIVESAYCRNILYVLYEDRLLLYALQN